MKIAIGGDHAGFEYKKALIEHLSSQGIEVEDLGPFSEESCDYPDYAHEVAITVEAGNADKGILICGSGNGITITANKHQGIRAALCWQVEIAELARLHNDANILCMPARFIELDLAKNITDKFLKTDFEGGRHERRVNKIPC